MAKILCKYSGLEVRVEHFPISIEDGSCFHPIFAVPQKKLWKYVSNWKTGDTSLTPTDSYLLFLALLKSTDFVDFRTSVWRTTITDSIVAANMESLASVVSDIAGIRHPRLVIPHFAVTKETRTLSNVKHWIEVWQNCYSDWRQGIVDANLRGKLASKEAALEKLIKNPTIPPERYAHILASWAAIAGAFPEFPVRLPDGEVTTCSEYWQSIICNCYNSINMLAIPEKDVRECLDHCEDNIELGSIFSYHLFNTLREGLTTIRGFFSIGSTTYTLVENATADAIESANLETIRKSAPIEKPIRSQYVSEFQFTRARMNWNLANPGDQIK
jgi:hypothetical protein